MDRLEGFSPMVIPQDQVGTIFDLIEMNEIGGERKKAELDRRWQEALASNQFSASYGPNLNIRPGASDYSFNERKQELLGPVVDAFLDLVKPYANLPSNQLARLHTLDHDQFTNVLIFIEGVDVLDLRRLPVGAALSNRLCLVNGSRILGISNERHVPADRVFRLVGGHEIVGHSNDYREVWVPPGRDKLQLEDLATNRVKRSGLVERSPEKSASEALIQEGMHLLNEGFAEYMLLNIILKWT